MVRKHYKLVLEQVKMETQEEKQCVDNLEKKLKEVFKQFQTTQASSGEMQKKRYRSLCRRSRGT
jgi:hypothetical protein